MLLAFSFKITLYKLISAVSIFFNSSIVCSALISKTFKFLFISFPIIYIGNSISFCDLFSASPIFFMTIFNFSTYSSSVVSCVIPSIVNLSLFFSLCCFEDISFISALFVKPPNISNSSFDTNFSSFKACCFK